jgi:hypothetical protein
MAEPGKVAWGSLSPGYLDRLPSCLTVMVILKDVRGIPEVALRQPQIILRSITFEPYQVLGFGARSSVR